MYDANPDGNQMEFQVDCFEKSEDASSFMNIQFAANPVGVEYDPDEWLSRLRDGIPVRGAIAAMI